MGVEIVRKPEEMQERMTALKREGKTIALCPRWGRCTRGIGRFSRKPENAAMC